eukprot:1141095-Pelagomonas_calceolata.AAC.2
MVDGSKKPKGPSATEFEAHCQEHATAQCLALEGIPFSPQGQHPSEEPEEKGKCGSARALSEIGLQLPPSRHGHASQPSVQFKQARYKQV